ANHYLADVAGLAFIAAALPRTPETEGWLAFAGREVLGELLHQFLPDGGSFEASTGYHRLSGEMVAFAVALLTGLPAERVEALRRAALPRTRPARPGSRHAPPEPRHLERLATIGDFALALTKPSGRIVQLGDNDSGRFFKLHPVLRRVTLGEARA